MGFTNFKDEKFNVTTSNLLSSKRGQTKCTSLRELLWCTQIQNSAHAACTTRVFNAIREQETVKLAHYQVLVMVPNIWLSCTLLLRVEAGTTLENSLALPNKVKDSVCFDLQFHPEIYSLETPAFVHHENYTRKNSTI